MSSKELIELFEKLTEHTYIYGLEDELMDIINPILHKPLLRDEFGNYYTKIGDSKSLFCSHLDTVGKQKLKVNKIHYNKNGRNFVKTDGNTILGADDKTGVVIMLNMIYNDIPGLYYFLIGEETGTVGSSLLYKHNNELLSKYDRSISFDRRGYGSIINRQMGKYSCSNEFVNALSKEFGKIGMNFKSDSLGVWTDTAIFMGIIPECTNLSVGYFNEHTKKESQDLDYMVEMCNAVININWEHLPIVRQPKPFDTTDPKKVLKQPNHLPVYKLYNIFEEVDELIYDETEQFASNTNFFKPGKEMTYFSVDDIDGVKNFSIFINWDGSIDIKKDENITKIKNIEQFRELRKNLIIILNPDDYIKENKKIKNFNNFIKKQ